MTKDEYLEKIGRRIRYYREACGMTQEEIGKKVGYDNANTRSTISKIERGKNDIPQSKVRLFADAFGITVSELVNIDAEPKPLQLCDLFEECYGKESFAMVQKFLKLNAENKKTVSEMIDLFTKREREKSEKSKEEKAM
jgi:transcriptional regulator with XRE-family HTH domain